MDENYRQMLERHGKEIDDLRERCCHAKLRKVWRKHPWKGTSAHPNEAPISICTHCGVAPLGAPLNDNIYNDNESHKEAFDHRRKQGNESQ
jgi:hypothetical protein